MATISPLVVTLQFDAATFETLDALRRRHFPPKRNFIPAHLTLFHALPGEEEASISDRLRAACTMIPPIELIFTEVRFLGRGVALEVASPDLIALRQRLASSWQPWLNAQDRQGYRPHVTIQNKVSAASARALYADLAADWQPFSAHGEGLLLWHYLGGPWQLAADFAFGGANDS